jgi:uncharacterized protein
MVTLSGALAIAAITLLAYAVKAATGFGPAIVVVSLGSLIIGPFQAVILAAFLDTLSGAAVMWLDRGRRPDRAWVGLAATMSAGAVAGGLLLPRVPTAALGPLVGAGVLGFGFWMLVARPGAREPAALDAASPPGPTAPPPAGLLDHGVVAAAGVSGGLIGVGGPPLVLYFGARRRKAEFRALIVPVLLAAAIARVATYGATGQVDASVLLLAAISLPSLPLGMVLGDRLFRRWSEEGFRMAIATLVILAGLRLVV